MGKRDERIFTWVCKKWNSPHPRERIKGFIGKMMIEGMLFVVLAFLITLIAFAVEKNTYLEYPGYSYPVIFGMVAIDLFYQGFCEIIKEDTEVLEKLGFDNQTRISEFNSEL